MKLLLLVVSVFFLISCGGSSNNGDPSIVDDATIIDINPVDTVTSWTERVDVVYVAKAEHAEGFGYTSVLSVDIPDDAVSFTINAVGTPGVQYHVDGLKSPTDNYLILENWKDSPLNGGQSSICVVCVNRVISSETAHSVLIPNSPKVSLESGTYTFRLFGYTSQSSGAFAAPTVLPASGTVDVTVAIKRRKEGLPISGLLDLNFYFTGADGMTAATAPNNPRFQTALSELETMYAQAGIGLGVIHYEDISDSYQVVDGFNGSGNAFEAIASQASDERSGANVFIVRELVDSSSPLSSFGVILGIAGGIPGPSGVQGTTRSAVLVSTQDLSGTVGGAGGKDTFGATMAHELGHYLGLFHTSELSFGQQQLHDPLPDTPENDKTNLMYFESSSYGAVLTEDQGFVLRNNPWVYSKSGENR